MKSHTEDSPLLIRLDTVYPVIEAAQPHLDAAGRLPDDLVRSLAAAGVFRMSLPKTLGGFEADPWETIEVIERLSWADGSVGWVAAIAAATNGYLSSRLPDATVASVWADTTTVVCGNMAVPSGVATPVDGGFRVTGRWSFGSGSYNSAWLAAASTVKRERVAPTPEGTPPEQVLVVVPAGDCRLLDNWDVVGLRATGSTDYTIDDLFVPAAFTVDRAAPPVRGGPFYRHRLYLLGHAAHALGIGRRAIETFEELAGAKRIAQTDKALALKASVQSDVAQAHALIGMARSYLRDTVADLWDTLSAGGELTLEQQGRGRLAMTSCVRNAVRAVDLMYEAAGASSIYETSPLARCFRDIHVASQHAAVQIGTYEVVGQAMLGVPLRVPFVL